MKIKHVKTKLILGSILPIVMVIMLSLSSYSTIKDLLSTIIWVDHTHEVIEQALKIEKVIIDMETGERGFLITGKDDFLEPYYSGKNDRIAIINTTKYLVSDNPSQLDRIVEIDALITQWENEAAIPAINTRNQLNKGLATHADVAAQVKSRTGKKIMDLLRIKLNEFKDVELSLLKTRKANSKSTADLVIAYIQWGTVFVALIIFFSALRLAKKITKPLNELVVLSKKVEKGDYSARSKIKNTDEIGILANTLNHMLDSLLIETIKQTQLVKELELYKQGLEDKVIQKTSEIEKRNQLLSKSESYLKNIMLSMVDGLITTNYKGIILTFSPSAERIFGYEAEEVIGSNIKMLMPNPDQSQHDNYLKNYLSGGDPKVIGIGREVTGLRKDKTTFPMDLAVSKVSHEGDLFFIGVIRDISDKKIKEIALKESKESAEKASKAKSEFLSSMSHELRTPLNAILGFSQLLMFDEHEPLTDDQRENTEQIILGGEHLLELVNDVLDLATIESGKAELVFQVVDVNQLLEETLTLVQPVINKYNAKIDHVCCCEQTKSLKVHADYMRTKQVLLNLISNAAKYNTKEGEIKVKCSHENNGMLRITVSDNGDGISLEKQKELFKPFSRLGAENSAIEGTGIGLVVCKELVESMHGIIGFESEVGQGASFWFELPLSTEEVADNKEIKQVQTNFEINGTVLYIEDNPANLKLIHTLFSRTDGLDLITAETAEEGLTLAEDKQPDIILMDINLPGMSGIEAVKCLKSNLKTRNIPVVALSAAATTDDIKNSKNVGFEKYLTKPIDIQKTLECIHGILIDTV